MRVSAQADFALAWSVLLSPVGVVRLYHPEAWSLRFGSRELLLFRNETGSNLTPPQTKKEEQGRELLPFQSVRIPPWSVVRNSAPPTTSLILFSLGHIVSYSPGRPQTGYAYKDVLKLVTLLPPSTCREPRAGIRGACSHTQFYAVLVIKPRLCSRWASTLPLSYTPRQQATVHQPLRIISLGTVLSKSAGNVSLPSP